MNFAKCPSNSHKFYIFLCLVDKVDYTIKLFYEFLNKSGEIPMNVKNLFIDWYLEIRQ
jgi:hypothetical protein